MRRAEDLGFDLAFGLAQWLGEGGYGGRIRYREQQIEPLMVSAALAPLTRTILLISTIHVLYGPWHPLHLAKFGATLDHISGGRWGVNVVTGYKESECRMFGERLIEHDRRYEMAAEFTDMMLTLWSATAKVNYRGRFWQVEDAFITPKPRYGRPIIVNAASSPAGIDFAARVSDLMFITSPGGSDVERACETLPAHTARIREAAAAHGRQIRLIINPHIICAETEAGARARAAAILDGVDRGALEGFASSMRSGDTKSWRNHDSTGWALGGNIQIIGSPEQVIEQMIRLKQAGCDGLQICFFDYMRDLDFFGERVLPLMKSAGLRV